MLIYSVVRFLQENADCQIKRFIFIITGFALTLRHNHP